MNVWLFQVGGLVFQVTELARPAHFVVVCNNGAVESGFESVTGVAGARAVLCRALDVFGRQKLVPPEVVNCPEAGFVLAGSVSVPVG